MDVRRRKAGGLTRTDGETGTFLRKGKRPKMNVPGLFSRRRQTREIRASGGGHSGGKGA